jgi:hypothetical protein
MKIGVLTFWMALIWGYHGAHAKDLSYASGLQVATLFREVCIQNSMTVDAVIATVASKVGARFTRSMPKEHTNKNFPGNKFIFSQFEFQKVRYTLQTVRSERDPQFLSCSIWAPIADLNHLFEQVRRILPARNPDGYLARKEYEGAQDVTEWATETSTIIYCLWKSASQSEISSHLAPA